MSGNVASYSINNEDKLSPLCISQNPYTSSDHPRQESAHAHSIEQFKEFYISAYLGSVLLTIYDLNF